MIVRELDINHDWTFGKGRNNYLEKNSAIAQNINTRLQSFLGDCFFDTGAGIDWFNLLGSKNRIALELAITATILNTTGVTRLVELSLVVNDNRRMTITYEVDTVYSGDNITSEEIAQTVDFLLTESGDVLITEGGSPITA